MNALLQDMSRTGSEIHSSNFVPPVDVYEDEHKIVLTLDAPGIRQEDLDVRLENNTLTIKGERKFTKNEKEQNFRRIKRRYGSFSRAFALPTSVDDGNVKAEYDAGVLKIELNKRAEAKPEQIKIGVASVEVKTENASPEFAKAAA